MCADLKIKFFLYVLLSAMAACSQRESHKYPSPPEYDFNKPVTIHLKGELDEISGILFYPKDTSIFAIQDERGMLYKIYIREKMHIDRWRFSEEGDYEDIALVDSTFYVLKSNGSVYAVRVVLKDSVVLDDCKSPYAGKNEFETLYYDNFYQKLILICKDCKEDEKEVTKAWAFDPKQKTYSDTPFFTLDATAITSQLGKKEKFKPSGAAIHPISKELYIISSVNKALVIANRNGKVRKVVPLDPRIFKQPEGITFSPAGHLLISNEAAEIGAANILIYKTKTTAKK